MTLGDGERALVASSVAALRRHGWPAGKALELVAERLPASQAGELAALAAALGRGEAVEREADPLAQLLARGEAAGPAALEEAVHGFLLTDEARRAVRAGAGQLLLVTGGLCLLLCVGGWVLEPAFRELTDAGRIELPITSFVLWLLRLGAFVGPVGLVLLVVVAVRRPAPAWIPGTGSLRRASALRLYAAARSAGLTPSAALALVDGRAADLATSSVLALDLLERAFLGRALPLSGDAAAARALGLELETTGRRSYHRFLQAGPVVALFLGGFGLGFVALAFYLPIFRLAGALN